MCVVLCSLAVKLKYHRLKPGGVDVRGLRSVAVKLKYHRLKPGGVRCASAAFASCKAKRKGQKPKSKAHCFLRHPVIYSPRILHFRCKPGVEYGSPCVSLALSVLRIHRHCAIGGCG